MKTKWFFSHEGKTHGPYTVDEMKTLAADGLISPQDQLWAEGSDPSRAITAATALDFKTLAKKSGKTVLAGAAASSAPPPDSDSILAPLSPAKPQSATLPAATPVSGLPPAALPVASPVHAKPAVKKTGRSHSGSKAGAPLKKKGASTGSRAGHPLKGSKAGTAPRKKGSRSGSKAGVAPPKAHAPAALPVAQPVTAAAPTVTPLVVPTLTLQERFRKAQFALEQWVDDDDSVDFILAADLDKLKAHPAVQAIVQPFAALGGDLGERLWKHLEFVAGNRQKYYRALLARRNG